LAHRDASATRNSPQSAADAEKKFAARAPTIMKGAVEGLPLPRGMKTAIKMALPSEPVPAVLEEEFPILGVYRGASEEDERLRGLLDLRGESTVVLPYATATDVVLKMPGRRARGFFDMTVIVDSEKNLKEVQGKIQAMTYGARSLLDFVEILQAQVATVTWVLSALAGISLFVSALGITNTMVMSVVERTHEIGVMKAVGARDGNILLVFLCEGAFIGLLGAAIAVLIGWLASFPLDAWARSALDERLHHSLGSDQVVYFPLWLAFAVPAFSAVVTTLAGIMPARRAARISPIVALRHE
jgi:putative ABC transport system permease protein